MKKKKKALEKDLALEALEKKQNRQNSVSLLFSIDCQDISSLVEKERGGRERERERDISFLVSTYVVGITFVRLFQQLSPVFGDLLQVIWNEDRFQEHPGL